MSVNEQAEAAAFELLNLRAHQLVVHLLGQGQFGVEPMGAAIDDVIEDVEPADAFARALGAIATLISPEEAHRLVIAARDAIPALMLRAEQNGQT